MFLDFITSKLKHLNKVHHKTRKLSSCVNLQYLLSASDNVLNRRLMFISKILPIFPIIRKKIIIKWYHLKKKSFYHFNMIHKYAKKLRKESPKFQIDKITISILIHLSFDLWRKPKLLAYIDFICFKTT